MLVGGLFRGGNVAAGGRCLDGLGRIGVGRRGGPGEELLLPLGERLAGSIRRDEADTGGIGGTLAGNALSLAAIRATLEQVLTEEAYPGMIARADRFRSGVAEAIREQGLPWVVQQLGCRAEYWFRSTLPRNGGEAAASVDAELDRALHLGALNRGILMTPFHNMALFCPATTDADVDRHTAAFREILQELAGP